MAIVYRFSSGSLLSPQTDAIALNAIMPIREALVRRGLVIDGGPPLHGAWMYLTPFTYVFRFEWREAAYERYELYAEYLAGAGEVRLNGHLVGEFDSGELRMDVTAALEEQNELRIAFKPFIPEAPTDTYDRGIYADVCLRATSFMTLGAFSVEPVGQGARVFLGLTAHCAGRYDFIYAVSQNGAPIKKYAFSEKLRALPSRLAHELPMGGLASGEIYHLRLTIERGGVACDEWDALFADPGDASAICAVGAESLIKRGGAFDESAARAIGLRFAQYEGRAPSLSTQALEWGLCLLRDGSAEKIEWPDARDMLSAEALDGALSRALISGRRALIPMPSTWDAASPAGLKLKSRLRAPHAFARRDDDSALRSGQGQVFEIWFAGDARADYPLSVSAVLYASDGRALKSCAFTAYARGTVKLGEMRLDVPESLNYALVRVATTGFLKSDSVIQDALFVKGGLPGASLPAVRLMREAGHLKNASGDVALIAIRGGGADDYGALLPGESITIADGAEITAINGEIHER